MKLKPNNLASLAGCSAVDVELYISGVLDALRSYTNRLFLTNSHQKGVITVTDENITLTGLDMNLSDGDVIELLLSQHNTQLMVVKEVIGEVITVYGDDLSDEIFSGYIVRLNFNVPKSTIIGMLKYNLSTSNKIGLRSETIGDTGYVLNNDSKDVSYGYPKTILSGLDRQMPDQEHREYAKVGLNVKQPFYR